jgi:Ca2+-binding EF-hand superfamily protein
MDEQKTSQLDADDFRWGFIDFGYNLSKEEAEQLVNAFDKSHKGTINFDDFIKVLRVSNNRYLTFLGCLRAKLTKLQIDDH